MLQISVVLDYDEVYSRRIYKGIKINESCCYIYVVVVMVTVRQGFLTATEAFTTVSDRWPADFLTADDVLQMFETTFFDHWVKRHSEVIITATLIYKSLPMCYHQNREFRVDLH